VKQFLARFADPTINKTGQQNNKTGQTLNIHLLSYFKLSNTIKHSLTFGSAKPTQKNGAIN